MKVKIIKYLPGHKEKLLKFLEFMWETQDGIERRKLFEWRYEKNPYTKTPFIFIAVHGEKIIGFRAYVAQPFLLKKHKLIVYSPADAVIHPEYRRQGIFSKLNTVSIEEFQKLKENGLILNLSSNEYSTPGYLKQGWELTNGIKKYGYRVSVGNLLGLQSQFHEKLQILSKLTIIKHKKENLVISKLLYSSELSRLISQNRPNNLLSHIRDDFYFKWRYLYQSEKYFYVYHYEKTVLKGFLIIRKISMRQCILEEYYAVNHIALKFMIKNLIKTMGIPILRAFTVSHFDDNLLKKCGFSVEPVDLMRKFGKKRLPILVRMIAQDESKTKSLLKTLDIRDINNWQIFHSYKH